MVFALSEDERSARGRKKASHSLLPEALGESLCAMAREYSGLVHQPPGLVGTSHTSVVPQWRNQSSNRIAGRRLETRRRYARHLVLVVAVGLRDDGREDAEEILSNFSSRDRAGDYFLLGRANDHCRSRV